MEAWAGRSRATRQGFPCCASPDNLHLGMRVAVHLVALGVANRVCRSVVLQIQAVSPVMTLPIKGEGRGGVCVCVCVTVLEGEGIVLLAVICEFGVFGIFGRGSGRGTIR